MVLSPTTICWEPEDFVDGNTARILAQGYSVEDVEDVLLDLSNETVPFHDDEIGTLLAITRGMTRTGKTLRVLWAYECGNPLMISPIRVLPA